MAEGKSSRKKVLWSFLGILGTLLLGIIGTVVAEFVIQTWLDSDNSNDGKRGPQVVQAGPTSAPPTLVPPTEVPTPVPPTEAPTPTPTPIAGGCWTWDQQVGDAVDASPTSSRWSAPPATVIDPTTRYKATIETSVGTIQLELVADESPQAVNNFICLARAGFFDETQFYRISPGLAIYGGDPTGTGSGGPGYHLPDEPSDGDYRRGSLAMVTDGPNTVGSRFFITLADLSRRLPPRYSIVGRVIGGQEVLDTLAAVPAVATPGGQLHALAEPVILIKVTIAEEYDVSDHDGIYVNQVTRGR